MYNVIVPSMRDTAQRSIYNALAMLLLVLRFGIPQRFLAILFKTSQQVVSDAVNRTCTLLTQHFVPHNLGFAHMTREQALQHTPPVYHLLYPGQFSIKVVIDGNDHEKEMIKLTCCIYRNLYIH